MKISVIGTGYVGLTAAAQGFQYVSTGRLPVLSAPKGAATLPPCRK